MLHVLLAGNDAPLLRRLRATIDPYAAITVAPASADGLRRALATGEIDTVILELDSVSHELEQTAQLLANRKPPLRLIGICDNAALSTSFSALLLGELLILPRDFDAGDLQGKVIGPFRNTGFSGGAAAGLSNLTAIVDGDTGNTAAFAAGLVWTLPAVDQPSQTLLIDYTGETSVLAQALDLPPEPVVRRDIMADMRAGQVPGRAHEPSGIRFLALARPQHATAEMAATELFSLLFELRRYYHDIILYISLTVNQPVLARLLRDANQTYLLTSQNPNKIRYCRDQLLQADASGRFRNNVALLLMDYDPNAQLTGAKIAQMLGVAGFAPAPRPSTTGRKTAPLPAPETLPEALPSPPEPTAPAARKAAAKPAVPAPTGSRAALVTLASYGVLGLIWLTGPDLFAQITSGTSHDIGLAHVLVSFSFIAITAMLAYGNVRRHLASGLSIARQLRAVTEHALAGIAYSDAEGNLVYANPIFRRLLNVRQNPAGATRLDTLLSARIGMLEPLGLLNEAGEGRAKVRLHSGHDGETEVLITARKVRLPDADLGWVVNAQLAGEAKAAREASSINMNALEMVADGITVVDVQKSHLPIIYVNRAFEDITGYSRREVIGKSPHILEGGDRSQPEIGEIEAAIEARRDITTTLRNYRKDGSLFWNQIKLSVVRDEQGRVTHYVSVMRDVTAQRQAAHEMEQLAYGDPLTGLPNRARFRRMLGDLLGEALGQPVLVACADVRGLHEVNTSAGHDKGDQLLIAIAQRLRQALPRTLIGRISGNEFCLAMQLDDRTDDTGFLKDLLQTLRARYDLPGVALNMRFAVGYTIAGSITADQALRQVEVAVHDVKRINRGDILRFDAGSEADVRAWAQMAAGIQQAINDESFYLHYQPKVDIQGCTIIGAEALARWDHPAFGPQRPDKFIAIAEKTGLILDLGMMLMRQSMRFSRKLNQDRAQPLKIAVNVSVAQLRQPDFIEQVRRCVADTGANPGCMTLEITESVFTEAEDDLMARLGALRTMGFGLALDDFGTGYSSFRYLQQFPVTEIKLDRSMVSDLHENAYRHALTESMVKIGNGLGIEVVAEGVEKPEEWQELRRIGCHIGQGHLFARAMSPGDFTRLVESGVALTPLPRPPLSALPGTPPPPHVTARRR